MRNIAANHDLTTHRRVRTLSRTLKLSFKLGVSGRG